MAQSIRSKLLRWYRENARDLPWRQTGDPYAIWVSEIMLQQTRVEAVLPYYQAFMQRFPTIPALAAASLDQVLKLWEGMGYYARARNLRRAAALVVEQHDGKLPPDRAQLLALPGIGDYTASAICSIAFGQDELALDGNLRRVLARLSEMPLDPRSTEGERRLRQYGESLLPAGKSAQFNQALMDLGSAICTPLAPRCERCPLQADCLARRNGRQSELPRRASRRPQPLRQSVAAIWELDGKVLIRRQPAEGLLGGLWAFPGGELADAEPPAEGLRRVLASQHDLWLTEHAALPTLEHSFTHFRIVLHPFRCQAAAGKPQTRESGDVRWVDVERLDDYPMGKLDRQLADQILQSP